MLSQIKRGLYSGNTAALMVGAGGGGGSTLRTNLIGWWEFESGAITTDAHGSNTLTNNNAVTSVSGKVSNAAQFVAASSQSLTRASDATIATGDIDFSLAMWVNPTTSTNCVVAKDNAAFAGMEYRCGIRFTDANRFYFTIGDNGGVSETVDYAGSSVSTSSWYFVAVICDKTSSLIKISVNDGTVSTTAKTITVAAVAGAAFSIGKRGASTEFFNGLVDQMGFWKKALSASEITQLYNGGAGVTYAATA